MVYDQDLQHRKRSNYFPHSLWDLTEYLALSQYWNILSNWFFRIFWIFSDSLLWAKLGQICNPDKFWPKSLIIWTLFTFTTIFILVFLYIIISQMTLWQKRVDSGHRFNIFHRLHFHMYQKWHSQQKNDLILTRAWRSLVPF